MIRTKEKSQKSLSVLIHELDGVFSEYVRVRDAKPFSGLVHCFICGVAIPWRQCHAMHYMDRDQMATRYDDINVNAGCQSCNVMDDDHRAKYRITLIAKYGIGEVQRLELRSRGLQKFMRPELIEKIGYYKGATDHLRKQKHI